MGREAGKSSDNDFVKSGEECLKDVRILGLNKM